MFKEIKPNSEVLKNYITSFSINDAAQIKFPFSYLAFPQLGTSLGLFKNAEININKEAISFSKSTYTNYSAILLGRILKPVMVTFNNPVEEIAINFAASGINYFFDLPFSKIAPYSHQKLQNPQWTNFSIKLFALPPKMRIPVLQDYLLSHLKQKPLLTEVTKKILANNTQSIKELAQDSYMSERNYLRYFHAHFGCSPSIYKKIIRFRNSINSSHFETKKIRLSNICYENSYYDISHLRRNFLQLTQSNPREFYNTVSLIGEGKYPFKLL